MGLFTREPAEGSSAEIFRIAALWPRVEELTYKCLSEAGLSAEQIDAGKASFRAGEEPGNIYQITHMMISNNVAHMIMTVLRSQGASAEGPASAMLEGGPEAAVADMAASGDLFLAEALGTSLTRYMNGEIPKMAAAVRRRI